MTVRRHDIFFARIVRLFLICLFQGQLRNEINDINHEKKYYLNWIESFWQVSFFPSALLRLMSVIWGSSLSSSILIAGLWELLEKSSLMKKFLLEIELEAISLWISHIELLKGGDDFHVFYRFDGGSGMIHVFFPLYLWSDANIILFWRNIR